MSPRSRILGLFSDEVGTVSALSDLQRTRWTIEQVQSPVPSHEVLHVLKRPKSKIGYFTLAGGIIGFFSGIGLAAYTSVQWHLIVGGKPVLAWIPFIIVGFEFTILFAVFGNMLGLLTQSRLPGFRDLEHHDPRCTQDRFGILVSCAKGQEADLEAFINERGGEVQKFEED